MITEADAAIRNITDLTLIGYCMLVSMSMHSIMHLSRLPDCGRHFSDQTCMEEDRYTAYRDNHV